MGGFVRESARNHGVLSAWPRGGDDREVTIHLFAQPAKLRDAMRDEMSVVDDYPRWLHLPDRIFQFRQAATRIEESPAFLQ